MFDAIENPLLHATTAFPLLTLPISRTAMPLGFGFLIVALIAVTANAPETDFCFTTLHEAAAATLATTSATTAVNASARSTIPSSDRYPYGSQEV